MTAKKNVLIRTGATAALAAAFLTVSMTSAAAASGPSSVGTMVEAVGTGSASAPPDLMTFTVCAYAQAPSVSAALTSNNLVAARLHQALVKDGIPAADVQTTTFLIAPDLNYAAQQPDGQPVVVGYHVLNCVHAILHVLNRGGKVLDDVAAAGGNAARISSVEFDLADPTQLDQRARDGAYNDAYAKLMQDAQNLGLNNCIPDTMNDNGVSSDFRLTAGSANTPQSVPLSGGEITREVTVTLSYRCF